MKAINIKWDTDGDMELLEQLPKEVLLPEKFSRENYSQDGEFDKEAMLDDLSDWLSDEYGFCHYGFEIVE